MKCVARFEKVSFTQFFKDFKESFPEYEDEEIKGIYENIKLPKRATIGSAGYDFFSPVDLFLPPNGIVKIPTGIRCFIEPDYVLSLYPRSGLGFKYRLQLNNTVGIIDSDYYIAKNEGHILVKLTNDTKEEKSIKIEQGSGFAQGIFTQYFLTYDDEVNEIRTGGFGSTTK